MRTSSGVSKSLPENVVAALVNSRRNGSARFPVSISQRRDLRVDAVAEQPARLVVQPARFRLELGALEQHRTAREQRMKRIEVASRIESHQQAVVRVADLRHVAAERP